MPAAALVAKIKREYLALDDELDDQARRDWAVRKAISLGRTGKTAVHEATGIALTTLRRGVKNLESGNTLPKGRKRRPGAGRPAAVEHDPGLIRALYRLLEPQGSGNHQAPLVWTCKSTRCLARDLEAKKHLIGATTILQLLKYEGFRVEANRRSCNGQSNPDRDAQFHYIHQRLTSEHRSGRPAILVEMYARRIPAPGKGSGTRKPAEDKAWESSAIDRETIAFAIASIHEWWKLAGGPRHPKASRLLLVTDNRVGAWDMTWKAMLQRLSDLLGLEINVCLMPPATSKWVAIECQLIRRLMGSVRARPAITHKGTVSVIGPSPGISGAPPHEAEIEAQQLASLSSVYEKERFVVRVRPAHFHGEWNYGVVPQRQRTK